MFLLLALACESTDLVCDTMAAYSVNVTVDGSDGAELTVTYSVDGEDRGACDGWVTGSYACGIEVAGHFVITLAGEGFITQTVETDVTQGECHVEPASLSVTMEPDECAPAASILVTLRAEDGLDLVHSIVTWMAAGGDASEVCVERETDGEAFTLWECGDNGVGDFEVTGQDDGHAAVTESVTVGAAEDGCGPVTESLELVLGVGR